MLTKGQFDRWSSVEQFFSCSQTSITPLTAQRVLDLVIRAQYTYHCDRSECTAGLVSPVCSHKGRSCTM